jgi:hypothetical protein
LARLMGRSLIGAGRPERFVSVKGKPAYSAKTNPERKEAMR